MASQLDWSGYAIPGYMAAQNARQIGQGIGEMGGLLAGGTAYSLFGRGRNLFDKSTGNLGEALRGQGRSYYKDNVDKSVYATYEDWLKSDESGRYLRIAEAGGQFRNIDGEFQVKSPGTDEWITMGTKGEGDEAMWDPYAGGNLTSFETSMRERMMGDWSAGDYEYDKPRSLLSALFSKERYKPVANLYMDAAKEGLTRRYSEGKGTVNWGGLETEPGGLGWYPGLLGNILRGKDKKSNQSKKTTTTKKLTPAELEAARLAAIEEEKRKAAEKAAQEAAKNASNNNSG